MKLYKYLILFIIFLGSLTLKVKGLEARAADSQFCAQNNFVLEQATPEEALVVCSALHKTFHYFQSIGIAAYPQITFVFADEVFLPTAKEEDRVRVYAYLNTSDNSIHMTHFLSPIQKNRKPWGVSWNKELAESFLIHELTHFFVIQAMGADFTKLPSFWHECIAYAIQFELMPEDLRNQVLTQFPQAKAYEEPRAVSAIAYEMDPDRFAVNAYLSFSAWGKQTFIKNLIHGKIPIE